MYSSAEIALYEQNYDDGIKSLESKWPLLKKSMLLGAEQNRIEALHFRARLYLGAAGQYDKRYLKPVVKSIKSLLSEKATWAHGCARLLSAGICRIEDRPHDAISRLEQAAELFRQHDMTHYEAAARYMISTCRLEKVSSVSRELTIQWFKEQGIEAPERFAAMLAPGFIFFD
jgi:hypothetical protein